MTAVKNCSKHGPLSANDVTTNKRCKFCQREYARDYAKRYPEKIKRNNDKYNKIKSDAIKEFGEYVPIRKNNRSYPGRTSMDCKKHGTLTHEQMIKVEGDYLRCRLCAYERNRSWEKRNPEKVKMYKRATYLKHCDTYSEESKLRQKGITKEQYLHLIESQNNKCAICLQEESVRVRKDGTRSPLSIDHDHETGKIRGLLCARCNRGLGCFKESEKRLINAIDYIRRNKDGST